MKILPIMENGGNGTVQTAASGANWTDLAAQACHQVTFVNNTGTTLEFRQNGGSAVPIFVGVPFVVYGIKDASQLSVRRVDQSNTQVTLAYRWES